MPSAPDFIRLPYTLDLTEGGIAYALKSLPNFFEHDHTDQIRRIITETAVELAFRRSLAAHNIPFEVSTAGAFSGPKKYHVMLGGRRCEIKSFFISRRAEVTRILADASVLLDAPALIPSDHFAADEVPENSLYLFAFVCGQAAAPIEDDPKDDDGKPRYMAYLMPAEWRKPLHWKLLSPVTLKAETDTELQIGIHGLDDAQTEILQQICLPPRKRVAVDAPFCTIHAIHIDRVPGGRLGVHSPQIGNAHIIPPQAWQDLWVHGAEIILAGYITRSGFRQQAQMIPPNTRVFQYDHTKTKNLAVPVSNLLPVSDLLKG